MPSGLTTPSSIRERSAAVWCDTTRVEADVGVGDTVPSASVTLSTRRGATRTPSFAIVWNTDAAWMAVTEMPWPNATVAFLVPLHVFDGGEDAARLAGVPGAGRARPSPNLRKYDSRVLGFIVSLTRIVPMLLDSARVPATVRYSVACSWLSLKFAS